MFDIFGEFDSFEEINQAAEGQFNEGDLESLKILAKENGIPEEYADMYAEGMIPYLCDAQTAALGKIDIESAELKPKEIMEDWVEYLKYLVDDEKIALRIRKKGKSLKGMIAALLTWSFGNQQKIDKDILEAAGVKARVTLGIPGMGRAKQIIKDYYLED